MATTASSSDPYAPFYYWDATANNWAFDYNGYYATYGYPQQQQQQSYAAGQAYPSASSGPSRSAQQSIYNPGTASSSSATAGPSNTETKPKKPKAGPKDAEGNPLAGNLKRGEHRTTVVRSGPDGIYEDASLLEWDPTHKRLFVGDLGNDVNDAMLTQAFQKYASFSKAKVIRKKADNKARGYGFVSFANPEDYLKAWKEMNGKYIGSRPCRLKAAETKVDSKEIGYRQDRMLANNVKHEEFKQKYRMGGAIGGTLRRHNVGKAWASK
ncbi:unnamed protein product [Jaminaea pallidilutea]